MSNGEILNQHNLARKVAAASFAGVAALAAMEGVADAGNLSREAKIYQHIHQNPQEVPNTTLVFGEGTRLFTAPFQGASLYQKAPKVPEGGELRVKDGLRYTDPETGHRYIGFTFRSMSDNESYRDLAKDVLWARKSRVIDVIKNSGPADVQLRVSTSGKVWSPDAKGVIRGAMVSADSGKITR
jgi:hypothetical protein